MAEKTWVVVANGCQARFLLSEEKGPLQELGGISNPDGRKQDADINTDRPGRQCDRMGHSTHGVENPISPREEERHRFVRQLAHYLDQQFGEGAFDRLYLIASPALLGDLRKVLSNGVAKSIVQQVTKDLTAAEIPAIRDHLPFVL